MDYVDTHGHSRVPQSYKVDGYRLGTWVATQRRRHVKGTLGLAQQHRLEGLPGWTWDTLAEKWEEGFSRLVTYVELHGHARVPRSEKVDGYNLGAWVAIQRTSFAKGSLDADRQRRLENLRGWTWDAFGEQQWEEGFSRLLEYVKRHHHARVPQSYSVDDFRLGVWLTIQRRAFAKGSLDGERQRRLEDLPG